jgi:hypothetical protein
MSTDDVPASLAPPEWPGWPQHGNGNGDEDKEGGSGECEPKCHVTENDAYEEDRRKAAHPECGAKCCAGQQLVEPGA